MEKKKKKIIHIIVGLQNGGAEMMLYKLLKYIDRKKYEVEVVSMLDEGIMGAKIESLGIPVYTLKIRDNIYSLKAFFETIKICKNADIIQTWMYHADLFGFIIAKILRKKIIWGIHHSNLEKNKNKKSTLHIAKINSFLSKWVNTVVSCSIVAKKEHIKYDYYSSNIKVIPNGFELDKFYHIESAKYKLAKEFPQLNNKIIFSLVARYEILKDHKTCLEAMKIIKNLFTENFILLLCGTGINEDNKELMNLIIKNQLEKQVLLLNRREDIPIIMSATDIYISSSSGEGFPNVIGEAMACETPCIVTDVGDSAYIIGDYGRVVERQCPEKLANEIIDFIKSEEYLKNKKDCRKRILNNFEIHKIVSEYEKLY